MDDQLLTFQEIHCQLRNADKMEIHAGAAFLTSPLIFILSQHERFMFECVNALKDVPYQGLFSLTNIFLHSSPCLHVTCYFPSVRCVRLSL
jgi:hypothetical protein